MLQPASRRYVLQPMRRTSLLLRPARTPYFGTYQPLRPPRSNARKRTPVLPNHVPEHIARPPYVPANFFSRSLTDPMDESEEDPLEGYHGEPGLGILATGMIELGGVQERTVRHVARQTAEVLKIVSEWAKPGVTTSELDEAIHKLIVSRNAYPSPLGYSGFAKSLTTSVNNVICHGIPDDRPLLANDIINLDLTLYACLSSTPDTSLGTPIHMHGDSSMTICMPDVDEQGRELVEVSKEALMAGIGACGPGMKFRDIGEAIDLHASKYGFSVNQQFTGHGIGTRFHTAPWILHHKNDEPGEMQPGHCFTIEPCLVQGDKSRGSLWSDGWTVATLSGARSAQFEHQVLITEDGVDILTRTT